MRGVRIAGVIILLAFSMSGYSQLNITKLGDMDYQVAHNTDLSDVWGYTDTAGNEYALVGAAKGFSIVDVTNPASPNEVFWLPGPSTWWRDIKTWDKHAYITNEDSEGLLIVDMSTLPNAVGIDTASYKTSGWTKAHNLYIDENGICYIFGANRGNGGAIFLDLADPDKPVEIGEFDTWYAHDGMARGDTLYLGNVDDGFVSIVNVSNKSNPLVMGTKITPNAFSHNIWVDDDNSHVFTTDEKSNAYIAAYDISNMSNIEETDRIQSNPGNNVIPHNTHVLNDYIITSYYADGVIIHDIADPTNLVEVGNYDTSPLYAGGTFNGCWGVYPYLPSGRIIATDIENGLYILEASYVEASRLEGVVTDAVSTNPISGAKVHILGEISTNTNISGEYSTGLATAGSYTVKFSKAGYYTDTAFNVTLIAGTTQPLNMALVPRPTFGVTGKVTDSDSGDGLPFADVIFQNLPTIYQTTADGNGDYSFPGVLEDQYEVIAGVWGHITSCDVVNVQSGSPTLNIQLDKGYYDDFTLDFNWTESGTAATGAWERGEPAGTTYNTAQSNPEVDVNGDCLDQAYVTGNAGGTAGDDDIDDGNTILRSPTFDLSGIIDPEISYYRWFMNDGGSGPNPNPNDDLVISITDGTTTVPFQSVDATATDQSQWVQETFMVSDYITPTSSMRLLVEAADHTPGHIVEAAFDMFQVLGEFGTVPPPDPTSIADVQNGEIQIAPNPVEDQLFVSTSLVDQQNGEYMIFDLSGKLAASGAINYVQGRATIAVKDIERGSYILQITAGKDYQHNANFIKL